MDLRFKALNPLGKAVVLSRQMFELGVDDFEGLVERRELLLKFFVQHSGKVINRNLIKGNSLHRTHYERVRTGDLDSMGWMYWIL